MKSGRKTILVWFLAFWVPVLFSWNAAGANLLAGSVETPVIRLLAAYTPAARGASCSLGLIRSQIFQAVQEINQSFLNSEVVARLELVGVVEVDYTESGDLVTDMVALRTGGTPFDTLYDLRDQLGADLVSLVVQSGSTCFASDIMTTISTGFAPYAYSVVRKNCMTGDLALAQAVGQNLGARMDWFTDEGTLPYPYSHGFISLDGRWRTIMSQETRCSQNGIACQHIPYWSNPIVQYEGLPTGISEGPTDCKIGEHPPVGGDCKANNAATLNESAPIVATFRSGGGEAWTPAQVLLVNDVGSGASGLESYYKIALDGLMMPYDYCSTGNPGLEEPGAIDLVPYQNVIWFTGDNTSLSTGPEPNTEIFLANWLDLDRCLLISSADYADPYDSSPTSFMRDYLGVESITSDVLSTTATGRGPFVGLGEYALQIPPEFSPEWFLMDNLQPTYAADIAFQGDAGDIGLFKMTPSYRTSYLAFPLEMIADDSERQQVLGRFLDTCRFNNLFLPLTLRP